MVFILSFFLFFFFIWTINAKIDNTVVVDGYIVLNDKEKIIQHYNGGNVKEIFVKEGEYVKKLQPLIKLNTNKINIELKKNIYQIKYNLISIKNIKLSLKLIKNIQNNYYKKIKLNSIKNNKDKHFFSNNKFNDYICIKKEYFKLYFEMIESYINVLNSDLNQLNTKYKSMNQKLINNKKNIKVLTLQYYKMQKIFRNKLITKEKLVELKMKIKHLMYDILEIETIINNLKYKILSIKDKKFNFLNNQSIKLIDELKKNQHDLNFLELYYKNIKNIYKQSIIRSPYNGLISELKINSIGMNLFPNDDIMVIIPQNDKLIIESEIKSNDIDNINIGNFVKIQLIYYKNKILPRIKGKVVYVSADIIKNKNNLISYGHYKIKVEIELKQVYKINKSIQIYPGMLVKIFIIKGTKTFSNYLFNPFKESFYRSFKE